MMKRITILLAGLVLLVGTFAGCRKKQPTPAGGTEPPTGTQEPAKDENYDYGNLDFEGDDIWFLNFDGFYGMKIQIASASMNSETVNDAIYGRNEFLCQKYNCQIKEKTVSYMTDYQTAFSNLTKVAERDLLNGDNQIDIYYLSPSSSSSLYTKGYFRALDQLDELHLKENWWDTSLIEQTAINEKNYIATGAGHLMPYEAQICIFFNKELANTQFGDEGGASYFYDLVRKENNWTIDRMLSIVKEAKSENDSPFVPYKTDAHTLYGVAIHTEFPSQVIKGCGVDFVSRIEAEDASQDGESFVFLNDTSKFSDVVDKVADLFDTQSGNAIGTTARADETFYYTVFKNQRALFLTGELKSAAEFSNAAFEFGILPLPKYNTDQEKFYTPCTSKMLYLSLSANNQQERSVQIAKFADALAYESYKTVVPAYYDHYLVRNAAKDVDSLEMLKLVEQNRVIDIGEVYGWVSESVTALNAMLKEGKKDISSWKKTYEGVQGKIDKSVEAFRKLA